MFTFDQLTETMIPNYTANDVGRLLRSLGATGRLYGYRYMEFIVDYMIRNQDDYLFLTKVVYPETAKCFGVTPSSVERAIRTLIQAVWRREDHSNLNYIAGVQLEKPLGKNRNNCQQDVIILDVQKSKNTVHVRVKGYNVSVLTA